MNTRTQKNIKEKNCTILQREIIDKLVYFSIFKFPLRASEIQNLLRHYFDIALVNNTLKGLVEKGVCYSYDGFYTISENIKTNAASRLRSERLAISYMNKIPFYVSIMCKFPFVQAVAISGSISKGVIHKNGDVDYFILTKENRLWITRVLLVLFKKVVLFNSRKYFCVNYFLSSDHLKIEDHNIFTATEIEHLIPVYNAALINRFKQANGWRKKYYGHFTHPIQIKEQKRDWKFIKAILAFLMGGKFGDFLDQFLMKLTVKRWRAKFSDFSEDKFNLTMRSKRDVSKHHPRDFQTMVLTQFEEKKSYILNTFFQDIESPHKS